MKNKNVLYLTQAAMIAAIYVVLTFVFAAISFGEVQLRIAEALTVYAGGHSWTVCRMPAG